MLKLLFTSFLVASFTFGGERVTCARKVDISQTSTSKHYVWYFWKATPPCTGRPAVDDTVVYRTYVYGRQNHVIVEVDRGNIDPINML